MNRLLLFDLDGTLLKNDKTISPRTADALRRCRQKGDVLGISTSRSESNCRSFLDAVQPQVMICSGGAVAKVHGKTILQESFSADTGRMMLKTIREICGEGTEITADTIEHHYWNGITDPGSSGKSWEDSVFLDHQTFDQEALKICTVIHDEEKARKLAELFPFAEMIRFSGEDWYKFNKKGVGKEKAVLAVSEETGIPLKDIIAFGDDVTDIGMLKMAGIGIAMGNAVEEVKKIADVIIGSNEEDGIAFYLEELLNREDR